MQSNTGSILVVDDTITIRKSLAFALKKAGHQVSEASNGAEALAKIKAHSFDLVLLDVEMPHLNGYEVLQQLKQDDTLTHLPVIVISANEQQASAVRCIELGAVDYLNKPFNPTLLHARVQSSLEKKILHDKELAQQKEVEQLYQALKQADEAKDEFVAMVAHELRNPINGLMAAYELIRRFNEKDEKQKPVIQSMFYALDSLRLLIEDLNHISQIEAGNINLDFEPVDMHEILDRVISSLEHKSEQKNHLLELEITEELNAVWADKFRLTQILTNLLSNAVKYTPENGRITIKASNFGQDSNFLHMTLKDNGVGMDQDALDQVFDKYYRVAHTSKKIEGIGLGMFITKALVEAHGGKIWIESQPGEGTAVHFTVPFKSQDEWSQPQNDDTFSPNFSIN